jgi:two-component system sensor histidine kinase VicK
MQAAQGIVEFLSHAGKYSGQGLAIADLQQESIIHANDNFFYLLDLKNRTFPISFADIVRSVDKNDHEFLRELLAEFKDRGRTNTLEFRKAGKDDQYLSSELIDISQEEKVLIVLKDITPYKEHQEYSNKYSAQKNALLEMLLHNLSGPLHLTKDLISVAEKQSVDGKKQTHILQILRDNTQHCLEIVGDFLVEEHKESAKTFVRKSRFSVYEKIKLLVDRVTEIHPDRKISITGARDLVVYSDPVKFLQIVHNLISNAIKFTQEDGTIDIQVTDEGHDFLICIKDDGVGVAKHLQPLLFKKQIRGELGLRGEASIGLGLHMVKNLVEMLKGRIWFDSQEQRGSEFYFRLPKS